MDSPRDHRFSAIWQALTEESRSELLTLARSHHPDPASPELIADIRRNGGMIVQPPWTPTPATHGEVIPANFLDWLNRNLARPGADATGAETGID